MKYLVAQFRTLKDSAAEDPLRRPFHGLFKANLFLYKHHRGEMGKAKLFHNEHEQVETEGAGKVD